MPFRTASTNSGASTASPSIAMYAGVSSMTWISRNVACCPRAIVMASCSAKFAVSLPSTATRMRLYILLSQLLPETASQPSRTRSRRLWPLLHQEHAALTASPVFKRMGWDRALQDGKPLFPKPICVVAFGCIDPAITIFKKVLSPRRMRVPSVALSRLQGQQDHPGLLVLCNHPIDVRRGNIGTGSIGRRCRCT